MNYQQNKEQQIRKRTIEIFIRNKCIEIAVVIAFGLYCYYGLYYIGLWTATPIFHISPTCEEYDPINNLNPHCSVRDAYGLGVSVSVVVLVIVIGLGYFIKQNWENAEIDAIHEYCSHENNPKEKKRKRR